MAAGRLTVAQWLGVCVFSILFLNGHALDLACIEVKKTYGEKGFSENEVPIRAISGEHLEICPQGHTCCTQDMENKLKDLSMKDYNSFVDESFQSIKTTFVSRTKKFDEFFTELLDNAKSDLHEMFVKTYGLLYQQNSYVFTKLFDDLRGYYKGSNINLLEALDRFFMILLQKMFGLLNSQYSFDEKYLNCVTKHMGDLKPFGDVPQKLSIQVKRAFIAARTFVQGLAIGRDVVLAISEIPPTDACTKALMKMIYCPHCRGLTRTKPCNNFCLNTLKGCLAYHAEMNVAWNEYIDALNMLATRLEGPFNIESVVDPIDVKISDAIMNLQENSKTVSVKIFAGCGQPRISQPKKRSVEEETDVTIEDEQPQHKPGVQYNFGPYRSNTQKFRVRPTTAAGTSLDRLVRDIKEKVKIAKDFWIRLPYAICTEEEVASAEGESEDCWNGHDRAKYIPDVQKDGVLSQINNPEVEVSINEPSNVIEIQIKNLKIITGKLHNAYNGMDVDWIRTAGDEVGGSGSGDGSEGDDEGDDDDDSTDGSGSGSGWYDPNSKVRPGYNDPDDIDFGTGPGYGIGTKTKPPRRPKPTTYKPDSGARPTFSLSWLSEYGFSLADIPKTVETAKLASTWTFELIFQNYRIVLVKERNVQVLMG
ncbi:hypothetical protein ScPMuIL_018062 [Solemya velum]